MQISQKCQYAVRAVFYLALKESNNPIAISDIASQQDIPQRFLENIMASLKNMGIVKSLRGKSGGYVLAKDTKEITVGEIISFFEGNFAPVLCKKANKVEDCPLIGNCPLPQLWGEAQQALDNIYGKKTFFDLVADARKKSTKF
ncbi:MAG: Rrf2 family transcriptional regulator [Alphaproteobacteria bacterium]